MSKDARSWQMLDILLRAIRKENRRQHYRHTVKASWPVVLLLVVLGVACSGGSYYFYKQSRMLADNGIHAQGTVTEIDAHESSCKRSGSNHSYTCIKYTSVIGYKDANGKDQSFRANSASSSPQHVVGEKVEVLYLKDDPKSAVVNSNTSLWLMPGALGLCGFFLFAGAVGNARKLPAALDAPPL